MPALSYTKSPFVPFTKIVSSDMNTYFADIKSRINWAGGTDATTGLGDSNIQSNTASGGGLTRSTKLKTGTANYAVYNDSSGNLTEAAGLPALSGGIGISVVVGSQLPGDVPQINSTSTAFIVSPAPVPPSMRPIQFYNF